MSRLTVQSCTLALVELGLEVVAVDGEVIINGAPLNDLTLTEILSALGDRDCWPERALVRACLVRMAGRFHEVRAEES